MTPPPLPNAMRSPKILPACDFCHLKKTRCDRRNPCDNCSAAKVPCQRRRQKQTSQNRKNGRMEQVLERMSRLEEKIRLRSDSGASDSHDGPVSLLSPPSTTASAKSQNATGEAFRSFSAGALATSEGLGGKGPASSQPETSLDRHQKIPSPEETEEGHTPEDKVLAYLDLQRYFELGQARSADPGAERQAAVETAISLAKQTMAGPTPEPTKETRIDLYDRDLYPAPEFLHIVLHESSRDESLAYFLSSFGICNRETLEKMSHELHSGIVHGQRRVRCIICVNHAAYVFLTCFKSDASSSMVEELKHSKNRYRDNILSSLRQLDTAIEPEPSLLWALQCGSFFMQDIGKMRIGWKLNTLACRVATALVKERSSNARADDNEGVAELNLTLMRCHTSDTAFSANIYQPSCLEDLNFDASVLNTDSCHDALLKVRLAYAQVHGGIIHETRNYALSGRTRYMNIERLSKLKEPLEYIRSESDKLRKTHTPGQDDWIAFEWLNPDFVFYSTITSIIRLYSKVEDSEAYQQCLDSSQKCLVVLKTLLDMSSCSENPARGLTTLARSVPLFALRPLYFCFRNLVETYDGVSLKLLREVAESLATPAAAVESIKDIESLFNSYARLYTDLLEKLSSSKRLQWPELQPSSRDRDAVSDSWFQQLLQTSGPLPQNSASGEDDATTRLQSSQAEHNIPLSLEGNIRSLHQPQMDPLMLDQNSDWGLWCSQSFMSDLDSLFQS